VRVVAALALVIATVGTGGLAAPAPALADGDPPPFWECVTVAISPPPPIELRPTVTFCGT
jgi:hypothetical protein